jgi:hypothetical protein
MDRQGGGCEVRDRSKEPDPHDRMRNQSDYVFDDHA